MEEKKNIPKLRFPGFSDAWEQRKLGELCERVVRKNKNSESDLPLTISSQDGLIDQRDFFNRVVAAKDMSSYYLLKKGEFAYNKSYSNGFDYGSIKRLNAYEQGCLSTLYICFNLVSDDVDSDYLEAFFDTLSWYEDISKICAEGARNHGLLNVDIKAFFDEVSIKMPSSKQEQSKISVFLKYVDNLVTLQQCKPHFHEKEVFKYMLSSFNSLDLFWAYYETWIRVYKEGAIRKPTMDKYLLTLAWLKNLAPNLKLKDVTRISYQKLLNDYAIYHERQTTLDFHHQLKGAVLDAVDDGLIDRDPTRKAIIKGKAPRIKKTKYLNQFELHKLLSDLDLGPLINWDWLILLIAKTGMRFSEALAVTPADFDFSHQMLTIDKTWDYKGKTGFAQTKNKSSVRKIQIDWQLIIQFSELTKNLPPEEPIFIKGNVYNSTINDILSRHCKNMDIPVISVHGLRHTHASLLLFAGVSIASVAQRLGHSSMTTTQKTYLHIIRELENRDVDLVMRSLSSLN